jgi:hypothetical protein
MPVGWTNRRKQKSARDRRQPRRLGVFSFCCLAVADWSGLGPLLLLLLTRRPSLSFAKMLSSLNAFEISNIQKQETE